MRNFTLSKRRLLAFVTLAAVSAAVPTFAETTNVRAHTANPGTSAFTFSTTMQRIVQRELPVKMNMTSGMASTRSSLEASRGDVDFYISAPAIGYFMENAAGPFAKTEGVKDLAKNLRGLINFPLGPYHIITFADSGIETMADLKGKRVFAGPPGGASTTIALNIIEASTGYKPGADFEVARLDWTSGSQAFQDRQVDLAVLPSELPSPSIAQFALLNKIRFIDIPVEARDKAPLTDTLSVPGRTLVEIGPDVYGENQVNDAPVTTVGSWIGIGTQAGTDEELVYQVTKAIFENIDEFYDTADWMKFITPETALTQMNVPLHAGALRYYREIGVDVPEELVPDDAQ